MVRAHEEVGSVYDRNWEGSCGAECTLNWAGKSGDCQDSRAKPWEMQWSETAQIGNSLHGLTPL